MRILVVGFAKIKYMPYMNFYLDNIDKSVHDVHLLYWNRDLKEEDTSKLSGITLHEFKYYQEDDVAKLSKIKSFFAFRHYAKHLLGCVKYDFVIVLHTLPAVLLADILTSRFSNRFILDYRDSTYESFPPFKQLVGKLVKHASATFVSSDAFRPLLPNEYSEKIYTTHNLLIDSLAHRDEKSRFGIPSDKIRIGFWGYIRHEEINREIIRKISLDMRIELHYYGREQQVALNLKEYVQQIGATNVFFHGEYQPEDRYIFVRETDIIHNIYDDQNMRLAMANKYYDGLIFRIPQICMQGSFMGECVERACVGFVCNPYDADFAERVYAYYRGLTQSEFDKKCDVELEKIMEEYIRGTAVAKI